MQTSASQAGPQPEHQREELQNEQNDQPPHHRHRRWFTVLQTLTLVAVLLLAVYNHALIDGSPEETLATPWLVESEPFEPLAPCNEGGSRVHTGFDVDGNGLLDVGERMDTVVLCNGMLASLDLKASRAKAALMRCRTGWRQPHSPWATRPALRVAS